MENVALVAFGDPNQALPAIHVGRKLFEKILKFLHGKRPFALKRKRLETVRRQMGAIGHMRTAGMELMGFVISLEGFGRLRHGNRENAIRLEQSDTEDERERDPALGCAHHARLRVDPADRRLNRSQRGSAGEVALVEQNDVAVTKLVARSLARGRSRRHRQR